MNGDGEIPPSEDDAATAQILENLKAWRPDGGTEEGIRSALKRGKTPPEHREPLVQALLVSLRASFGYIGIVNDLATTREVSRQGFLFELTRVVEALDALVHGHSLLSKAFGDYHASVVDALKSREVDTLYFDAIQNFDVKGSLKSILKDVELLLRSFSLVSAELSGVRSLEWYEACVRFHLYVQYLIRKDPLTLEECWSVLFDLRNLFGGETGEGDDGNWEDLDDFRDEIDEIRRGRTNNN